MMLFAKVYLLSGEFMAFFVLAFSDFLSFYLREHRWKTAGGGLFLEIQLISLGKRNGKPPGAG